MNAAGHNTMWQGKTYVFWIIHNSHPKDNLAYSLNQCLVGPSVGVSQDLLLNEYVQYSIFTTDQDHQIDFRPTIHHHYLRFLLCLEESLWILKHYPDRLLILRLKGPPTI